MIRLHYSDGFLTTSESIAHAVMQYAQALSEKNLSDVVTIPIVDVTLDPASATMLIGPASQLYTSPDAGKAVHLDDDDAVADLLDRAERVRSGPKAAPVDLDADQDAVEDWVQEAPPSA